jgi:hypothetical protein
MQTYIILTIDIYCVCYWLQFTFYIAGIWLPGLITHLLFIFVSTLHFIYYIIIFSTFCNINKFPKFVSPFIVCFVLIFPSQTLSVYLCAFRYYRFFNLMPLFLFETIPISGPTLVNILSIISLLQSFFLRTSGCESLLPPSYIQVAFTGRSFLLYAHHPLSYSSSVLVYTYFMYRLYISLCQLFFNSMHSSNDLFSLIRASISVTRYLHTFYSLLSIQCY